MSTEPRLVYLGNFTLDDVVLPDGRERPGCIGGDALYAALAARLSTAALAPRDLPTLHNRVVHGADGDRAWTLYASEEAFEALSPTPCDLPPGYRAAGVFLVLAMALPRRSG